MTGRAVLAGRRVLVAAAEPSWAAALRVVLEGEGCAVLCCDDRVAARCVVVNAVLDLLLVELESPDEEGALLVRFARSLRPWLPVLVLGAVRPAELAALQRSWEGPLAALPDPSDAAALRVTCRRLLSRRGTAAERGLTPGMGHDVVPGR